MGKIIFPIIGPIDKETAKMFTKILSSIGPGDELISYIASQGGDANISSEIASTIAKLPIETTVYGGSIIYSGAILVFSSFKKRFAFFDSKFLVHNCIQPKGTDRTEIFDEFDLQFIEFMARQIDTQDKKTLLEKLVLLQKKGKSFSSKKALEIGLVHKMLEGSYKEKHKELFQV